MASQVAQVIKNLLANAGAEGDMSSIPGSEDPLEKEMATHSSILAQKIPWTEERGKLQSMGSQRIRHDLTKPPPSPPIKIICDVCWK